MEEDCWTPKAAIEEARNPRKRDYVKKGYEARIKPFIDADLAELKKLKKDDEFYLPEKCDLPKPTGEELEMVSLAKRIDKDLSCSYKLKLESLLFSFGLGHGTLIYILMSLPKFQHPP